MTLDEAKVEVRDVDYWRARALRAEGWASAAEHDAVIGGGLMPYVIIDVRSIVGNTPLFWMPDSGGYGTVISEIGRYPLSEASRKRETDFPVALDLAVKCARPRIDCQLLQRELEILGLPTPRYGWGGPTAVNTRGDAPRRRR